ncbi:hypothetical protein K1719_038032 [Acacia pycnantha]|nr:hypothetical protein K1719_038032 [Acacia pycnantha]
MADEAKAKGNAAFSSGNFSTVICHFFEAITSSKPSLFPPITISSIQIDPLLIPLFTSLGVLLNLKIRSPMDDAYMPESSPSHPPQERKRAAEAELIKEEKQPEPMEVTEAK